MELININREVLRLAIPSILANITIPLVGIVDTAIAGHISDASAIGGIAVGSTLFDLLYWNFGFLRVGTAGMTAQAFGRNDKKACTQLLAQSVAISGGAALLIWLIQWFFVTAVLYIMPCSEAVADFAKQYFHVRIWAAPAALSLMAFKGWFIGMQNTIAPMISDIVVNVVNMIASYTLAVFTPLGAMGVAWGTLIAQYTGLATVAVILVARYRTTLKQIFSADFLRECLRWQKMRRLFVLNSNLFIRSLCFMVVYVGYTAIASHYGDTELAISSILMKFFMFFSYFVDGFAYAGEALIGRYGAKQSIGWEKNGIVKQIVIVLFVWAIGIGLQFSLLYGIFRNEFSELMTNNTDILEAAKSYYIWLVLMPFISSLAFMWDGIYIGATAAIPVRNCMIWAAIGFTITYFALQTSAGTQALYAAYFMHLLIRTVYMTIKWKDIQ